MPRTGAFGAAGAASFAEATADALDRRRGLKLLLTVGRGRSETEPALDVGREVEMEERREAAVEDEPAVAVEVVEAPEEVRSCSDVHVFLTRRGAGSDFTGSAGFDTALAEVGSALCWRDGGRLKTGGRSSVLVTLSSVCSMVGTGFGGAGESRFIYAECGKTDATH